MAISAYILKIVEKDPFLRLQMRAKKDFNRHQCFISDHLKSTFTHLFIKTSETSIWLQIKKGVLTLFPMSSLTTVTS